MKTYDLVQARSDQATDGFVSTNGFIMHSSTNDVDMEVVPYGHEYPAPLVTSSQPNQKDGITNGTFTSDANDTAPARPATTISGNGSGATFVYVFDANGDLDSIKADGAGTGYLEGDHLSITTTSAHGSQTIKFRLVQGKQPRRGSRDSHSRPEQPAGVCRFGIQGARRYRPHHLDVA